MFKNLINYAYKRNLKEAVGFYIAYLILIVILASLVGAMVGAITRVNNYSLEFKLGQIIAALFSLILSFLILYKKKLLNNFLYIILAILSGLLAYLGGGIFGLIPAAYLSSR